MERKRKNRSPLVCAIMLGILSIFRLVPWRAELLDQLIDQSMIIKITAGVLILSGVLVVPIAIWNRRKAIICECFVLGIHLIYFLILEVLGGRNNGWNTWYKQNWILHSIFFAYLCLFFFVMIQMVFEKRCRKKHIGFEVLYGTMPGSVIPIIGEESISIGRDAKVCHFVILEGKVSRKHCTIQYNRKKKQYCVTDYSTNGTYVNRNRRLESGQPTLLHSGDVLWLGDNENVLRLC